MWKKALLVLALSLVASAAAFADDITIFSQDWNTVAPGTYGAGSTVGSLFVSSGSIDVLGGSYWGNLCTSGGYTGNCADLAGLNPGTVISAAPITFVAGTTYTVTFQLAGNQRGYPAITTLVSLGSMSFSYLLPSNQTLTTYSFTFVPDATFVGSLSFQDMGSGSVGDLLGSVTITDPPNGTTSVPEPTSLMLFGSGMVSAAFFVRRKIFKR